MVKLKMQYQNFNGRFRHTTGFMGMDALRQTGLFIHGVTGFSLLKTILRLILNRLFFINSGAEQVKENWECLLRGNLKKVSLIKLYA